MATLAGSNRLATAPLIWHGRADRLCGKVGHKTMPDFCLIARPVGWKKEKTDKVNKFTLTQLLPQLFLSVLRSRLTPVI